MREHIIVCGTDALAGRIADELRDAGTTVVPLQDPRTLDTADVAAATAVVCVGDCRGVRR